MAEPSNPNRSPQDFAAERALLGGLLGDRRRITDVASVVASDDFFYEPHSHIYAALLSLDGANKPVDTLTLAEHLKTEGKLGVVGGLPYLAELDTAAPFAANALEYARIVSDVALRRRVMDAGRDIVELAGKEEGSVEVVVDEAQKKVFDLGEKKTKGVLKPISEIIDRTLELLDQLRQTQGGVTGLRTGFYDLDKQLTGLHAGELIILAARPGVGKTSLALNMAVHAAMREKAGVAVFSLEMPAEQLVLRLLSSEARVSLARLRQGGLSDNDMTRLQGTSADMWSSPLYIDDSGSLTVFDLRAKARRLKTQLTRVGDDGNPGPGLGLIVIDYLQLMTAGGNIDSREQQIATISRALKQLAKELEVPIVALSQLNRKVEERKGGLPMLSDLRESGSIEQDADVVMFIHPDEQEGEEDKAGGGAQGGTGTRPCLLIVAKQRNGPTGEIPLLMLEAFTKFESAARRETT